MPHAVRLGVYAEAVLQQDTPACQSAGAEFLFCVIVLESSRSGRTFIAYYEELLL